MSHLAMLLQRFLRDESGAALVEYVVIFAILLAGAIGILNLASTELNGVLTDIQNALAGINGLNP